MEVSRTESVIIVVLVETTVIVIKVVVAVGPTSVHITPVEVPVSRTVIVIITRRLSPF